MSHSQRPQPINRDFPSAKPPAKGPAPPASAVSPEQQNAKLLNDILSQTAEYVPLGEQEKVKISPWLVQEFLSVHTKQGHKPTVQDCLKFTVMCRQRQLNPFAGDAYLVGYDTQYDGPKFSIITSIQALLSRAELNKAFEGMESGVIVLFKDGETTRYEERQGDFIFQGETLLGGWCRVYRTDRKMPFYQRLNLSVYDKGTAQWKKDGGGMICKCAEAAALRQAFPSIMGGMYLRDEIEAFQSGPGGTMQPKTPHTGAGGHFNLDQLSGKAPSGSTPDESSQIDPNDDPFGNPQNTGDAAPQPGDEDYPDDESGTGSDAESGSGGNGQPETQQDDGTLLTNYQFDIEQAKTNGQLDKIADDAGKNLPPNLRGNVMKLIAARREQLKLGGKKQPGLPGAN